MDGREKSRAKERDTGARALRGIIEELMLDIMFELPSHKDLTDHVINAKVVRGERSVYEVSAKSQTKAASGISAVAEVRDLGDSGLTEAGYRRLGRRRRTRSTRHRGAVAGRPGARARACTKLPHRV